MFERRIAVFFLLLAAVLASCADASESTEVGTDDFTKLETADGKFDASAEALFLDMEFDGQAFVSSTWGLERKIEDQLLYTIGQLNGENSVGRIDKLELSNIETEASDGGYVLTYHAKLLVAWGDKDDVPTEFTFILPRDITYTGLESFTEKYNERCIDYGAHDVTANSMWYYYRPARGGCEIADEDAVRTTARATLSEVNTTGKFPEYDMVWADDTLRVVAVHGKYEDGATSSSDAGISAYNELNRLLGTTLGQYELTTVPAEVPSSPGVAAPEISYSAVLPDGRRVEVVAMLVDNVRTAGPEFDARYASLSGPADLIVYMGHSGLGANIRALASKGEWFPGQYAMLFINGCDTYAYVDSALNDAHAAVNPDDPEGTKYMDLLMNAMPSYFRDGADSTMAIVDGLLSYDDPKTYEQIFRNISRSQVVIVSGEHDNVFQPGDPSEPAVAAWPGLEQSGTVARDQEVMFETPVLDAGTYIFDMTGSHDADLYLRIGSAPTARDFDCRPYKSGSRETCRLTISNPTALYGMVRGFASSSEFELQGRVEP